MSFTGEMPKQKKWLPGYILLCVIWGRYHKILMVKVLKKLWKWIKLPSHLLVYLPFEVHARLYVGSLLESHPLRHKKIKETVSESESLDNGILDWIV